MLVLHCCWEVARGALVLWAESSDPSRHTDFEQPDDRHPFAVDPGATGWLTADQFDTADATVWLPSRGRRPLPSPWLPETEPPPDDERPPGAEISIQPWLCPARIVPPAQALVLLDHLADAQAQQQDVVLAAGSRYFTELIRFARELVRRGRVLPWAAGGETPGTGRALWRPVLTGDDAAMTKALVAAMPPSVRGVGAHVAAPASVVADALDLLVHAAVGRRVATRRRRPTSGSEVSSGWRRALSDGLPFAASPDQLAALIDELGRWQADAASGPVRARFRLIEPAQPQEPPGESAAEPALARWRVDFGLVATEEPSLSVDAAHVWSSAGVQTALATQVAAPRETLLTELGRACRLWPGLKAALRTARPTSVDLDTAGAHAFLLTAAPSLAGAGFAVQLPSWWGRATTRVGVRAAASSATQPGSTSGAGGFGVDALVDFRWQLAVGDQLLTEDEIEALAEAKQPLVRLRGQWVAVDEFRLRAGLDLVAGGGRQITVAELFSVVTASAPDDDVPVLGFDATGWLGELLAGETNRVPTAVEVPDSFKGTLRPYQARGLSWLNFLQSVGVGGILADDMGLGKTVQLLALFAGDLAEPRSGRGGTLLVCPMSLVGNWQREAARFAPDLRVHVHHGAERARGAAFVAAVGHADLVITTYAIATRDGSALSAVDWRRIVLDEAQAVKNAATKTASAIRAIPAHSRIAVTGTPVENRLADLWSLMEFTNPGLLGRAESFRRRFAQPIERDGDQGAAARLRAVTQPFVLRRLKTDRAIISDLPERLEIEVTCTLTREQASLYQAVVEDMLVRIDNSEGIERRGLVLATMTKLKQVCNHPAQFLRDGSAISGRSGKLERVEEIVEEILASGEKVLLFSQFAEFGAMVRARLGMRFGVEVLFLHGGVGQPERDAMVSRFQSEHTGSPPVFVLSLKAGGTGLTLTAANHVIHLDRWWNPAVEDQASDRVYRIGQSRAVQIRKLVCAGTLEEKISAMIAGKRSLAASVVGSGEGWLTELSTEQLRDVITLDAGSVVE